MNARFSIPTQDLFDKIMRFFAIAVLLFVMVPFVAMLCAGYRTEVFVAIGGIIGAIASVG
jgi:hypothetical protein